MPDDEFIEDDRLHFFLMKAAEAMTEDELAALFHETEETQP